MVSFCNPGVLGTTAQFRKIYEAPILAGREPDASDEAFERGEARSQELSSIVNDFILRRTNTILSAHLPPKVLLKKALEDFRPLSHDRDSSKREDVESCARGMPKVVFPKFTCAV